MNPEVKKLWLEALRSGRYKQTTIRLRDDHHNFCCLGVLTDLYLKQANKRWHKDEYGNWGRRQGGDGAEPYFASSILPGEVTAWAELEGGNPSFPPGITFCDTQNIAEANDYGATFLEIADLIEEHL